MMVDGWRRHSSLGTRSEVATKLRSGGGDGRSSEVKFAPRHSLLGVSLTINRPESQHADAVEAEWSQEHVDGFRVDLF